MFALLAISPQIPDYNWIIQVFGIGVQIYGVDGVTGVFMSSSTTHLFTITIPHSVPVVVTIAVVPLLCMAVWTVAAIRSSYRSVRQSDDSTSV